MSEPIKTKICSKCKQIKPISEFAPRCDRPSGLQSWCRMCQKEHRQKPESIILSKKRQHRYRTTDIYREKHRQECKSVRYKNWLREYRKKQKNRNRISNCLKKYNKKKLIKEKHRIRRKIYNKNNPNKVRCFHAVKYAVKTNKMPNVKTLKCFYCKEKATHYHHWHGYDIKHTYDVIPVCAKCHYSVHKAIVLSHQSLVLTNG